MVSSPVWSIAIRGRLCLACHKEGERQRVDEKGLSCAGRRGEEDKPMAEEKAAAAMITMNTIRGATTATAMPLQVCSNSWNCHSTLLVNDIPIVVNYSTRCRQLYVDRNF